MSVSIKSEREIERMREAGRILAIVNEEMHFTVTGDFAEGKNYLSFRTAEECLEAVRALAEDPERLYAMKLANERYYQDYLRPDVLVKNTLDIVDKALEKKI